VNYQSGGKKEFAGDRISVADIAAAASAQSFSF